MRKIGIFFISLILFIYISFVIFVPLIIQPMKYKEDIQNIVKNSCGLNVNFENAKIITTPMLSVGMKVDNIDVSIPEKQSVFKTDSAMFRLSLPSLLLKTIKLTCIDAKNPQVNLDINQKGSQYELVDFLNNNTNSQEVSAQDNNQADIPISFDNIKIKINKLNISNYIIQINDKKNKHNLELKGDNLFLKFDGENLILKSNPKVCYDNKKNISANFNIKTFIPDYSVQQDSENSTTEVPFINIVEMYGKYDLKSDINSKLTIENDKDNNIKINGNLYITDTSLKLSNIEMPKSYLKLDFGGYNVNIDTNICITEKEKANILGSIKYGKDFKTDIAINTDKIYLTSILKLAKALINSFNLNTPLDNISANGYLKADMKLNTDLKTIKSSGKIILADASIKDSSSGLLLNNIKSNILFDNNNIKIENTEAYVNGTPIKAEGIINENSEADVKIYTKNLPLAALYSTFAPEDLKKTCLIKNGILSLDVILKGKLENIAPKIKTEIVNLVVRDNADDIDITNGICNVDIETDLKTYSGKITNKNLVVNAPAISVIVRNSLTAIDFNNTNINIKPTDFVINGVSTFNIAGSIHNYIEKPEIEITGNGSVRASDIKNIAGKDLALFIKSSGIIPVKMLITGDNKKQNFVFRAYGSANEYITPIDIKQILGKPSTLQLKAEITNNKINLNQTGLYENSSTDLKKDLASTPLISITGGVNLDKDMSFDNIKISTNGNQNLGIYAFTDSFIKVNADISVLGSAVKPILKGNINAEKMNIPQLHTMLENGNISLNGNTFGFDLKNLNLNGTTIAINGKGLLDYKPIITITDCKILSDDFNADKAMQVTEYMTKVPALNSGAATNASMPVKITSGSININKLTSGDIVAENILSEMTLLNDIVYLNKLKANAFDGIFNGKVSMNLITSAIKATVSGEGMNADKTVTACAAMKNTIFGTLSFNADITLKGATYEEQMKTLNGKADFNISKGQFGSFGKFETFLKADNLASITFISSKIGGLINKISPHNTADFEKLNGQVSFKNGLMTISQITSTGKNMSLYITGSMNLVNNYSNLLILGRISDEVTSLLGPLEQLNPVKLLQKSSSTWAAISVGILNSCNQKSTPAEINKIPQLTPAPSTDNTSKFVVKIAGNIEKPQSAVKSFKWLSPETDLNKAQTAISPKEVVENVVKSIPKSKEEAVNTLKEAGKNTLMNLGKQLLAPTTENKTETIN